MKILALIGSRFFQHILTQKLSFLSRELTFVTSVASAKIAFEGGEFDLLCIERYLVDGSGLDLCKSLRAHPSGAKVPILLLTTSDDAKVKAESEAVGVTRVFSKYEFDQLADYVSEYEKTFLTAGTVSGNALLVEDSTSAAHVITAALNRIGLNVQRVASAEEAWTILGQKSFDVVVSDIQLEGNMTGLGLVRAIRQADAPLNRVPILAISGTTSHERKVELLRHGANDFVSKPLLDEELEMRVRNMVQHKKLFDEAESQRDHLRRVAMTDQLTGLYNRHYMADVGTKRMTEALKHGIPVSLILIDLDHFKKINDTHGHDVGDLVLAESARVLRDSCLQTDIASRAGGEEFVMMLINRDAQNASGFGESLRQKIESLVPGGIRVTASVGVATVKKGCETDFKTLFKAADEATYEAKSGGRNRVVSKEVEGIRTLERPTTRQRDIADS